MSCGQTYGGREMASQSDRAQAQERADTARHVALALRTFGQPNAARNQFDFSDDSYEWRRLFSELFGTFLLVLAAAGGGMVNARFGGDAVSSAARVVAP